MKKIFVLLAFTFVNLFGQSNFLSPFNHIDLSLLGGANFNSISKLGGSLIFEGKTNLSSKTDLKISVGFSSLYENTEYTVKSYERSKIEGSEGYSLQEYDIDQIQYTMIPVNLGFEYKWNIEGILTSAILEAGYNFYNREDQVSQSRSVNRVNSLSQIPAEYLNDGPVVSDGSDYSFGAGLGLIYPVSQNLALTVRYMFRYNNKLVNSNQILFGIVF